MEETQSKPSFEKRDSGTGQEPQSCQANEHIASTSCPTWNCRDPTRSEDGWAGSEYGGKTKTIVTLKTTTLQQEKANM